MEPERLKNSPKYRVWKKTVEEAGCVVHQVDLLCELNKRDGSPLFALLSTHIEDPEGKRVPPYLLIRGHACVIVTVVVDKDSGQQKFLMVRQRRIGHGQANPEFPAGMLDAEVNDPAGVAVRELLEEAGLRIRREDLHPLADRPLYSSAGLDDEAIHFFTCKVTLPSKEFQALEGGQGGVAEEGEHIKLGLWEYADAIKEVNSLQVRLAFFLYFEWLKKP